MSDSNFLKHWSYSDFLITIVGVVPTAVKAFQKGMSKKIQHRTKQIFKNIKKGFMNQQHQ